MSEEAKIFAGKLFSPAAPELVVIKRNTHNLCTKYNHTYEDDAEVRQAILSEIFGELGDKSFYRGQSTFTTASTPRLGTIFLEILI